MYYYGYILCTYVIIAIYYRYICISIIKYPMYSFRHLPEEDLKIVFSFLFSNADLQKQFLREKNIWNVQETLDYITYVKSNKRHALMR